MLVVKYPDESPFRHVDGRLKDLELPSGMIKWVIEEDRLVAANIATLTYSLVDELYAASSESWRGRSSSFLYLCIQQVINKCNKIHAKASYRLTNGQFELTAACLVDQPNNDPSLHSMDGDLDRWVYGKLPKEWGEFPPLTVLTAANAVKGKVDEYLSIQENLDKILSKVS